MTTEELYAQSMGLIRKLERKVNELERKMLDMQQFTRDLDKSPTRTQNVHNKG